MRARDGFTLLEICLAVFIAVLLVTLAVPSVNGLFAEQRMKKSFEALEDLVHEAQDRSRTERRAFVLAWDKTGIALRPKELKVDEEESNRRLDFADKETYEITLPAALIKAPEPEWIFWPSGTCEPATIVHRGETGDWSATYDPLNGRAVFAML